MREIPDATAAIRSTGRIKKKRRPFVRVVIALILVGVLALGAEAGYLYWKWRSIHRVDWNGSNLTKVAIQKVDSAPVVTIAIPTDGNEIPEATVPKNTGTETASTVKSNDGGNNTPGTKKGSKATDPKPSAASYGPLVDTSGVERLGGKNTVNILMLGLDSRDGIPDTQRDMFGKVGGSRTDTMMILRIDRDTRQSWILSLPRDLWVRQAGSNKFDRLNASYGKGLNKLVDTIQENLQIPIWHVVFVNFVGFQKVVEAIGGVDICFELPTRDILSGLNQPPGCNRLDSVQATAYVRSRHLQTGFENVWTEDKRGDIGRMIRQQNFLRAALTQSIDRGLSNPTKFNATLSNLMTAIAIDTQFNLAEVTRFANEMRSIRPDQLATFNVPVKPKRIDSKEVLLLDTGKAAKVLGQFGAQ